MYTVSEVEVISAQQDSGEGFRIVKIENGPVFDGELSFDGGPTGDNRYKKVTDYGDDHEYWSKSGQVPTPSKDWLMRDQSSITFNSIFEPYPIELKGVFPEGAKYRIRLVKACPVRITYAQSKEIKNSGGFISVPKLNTVRKTNVEKPTCFDESDRVFRLGLRELPPELNAAALQEAERKKAKEREHRDYESRERLLSIARINLKNEIAKLKSTLRRPPSSSEGAPIEEQLRSRLCPDFAAHAKVLGVKAIVFEVAPDDNSVHELLRGRRSTLIIYDSGKSRREQCMHSALFTAVKRLDFSESTCLNATFLSNPTSQTEAVRQTGFEVERIWAFAINDRAIERVDKK